MNITEKQELKFKKYKSLENRLNEIRRIIKKIPWSDLEKPVHSGYEIFLSFREDIRNQEDFENFQKALSVSTKHTVVSSKEKVKNLISKEVRTTIDEKTYNSDWYHLPKIFSISVSTYEELESEVKKYFQKFLSKNVKHNSYQERYFLKIKSYMLYYDFRKHYLTRIKDVPHELEVEENSIRDIIYSDEFRECWKHAPKTSWKKIYNQKYRSKERTIISSNFELDELEAKIPKFKKSIKWDMF